MTERLISWDRPDNETESLQTEERDGRWFAVLPNGDVVLIPGSREMKVKEMVGKRIRTTRRYGQWIEIDRDTARSDPDLLHWCRQHCNSELPSGTFRFSPKDWEKHSEDPLSTLFCSGLDDPSPTIRKLAQAELGRRILEQQSQFSRNLRNELVRAATKEGHSRRKLAKLLGVSFARVHQLVHDETRLVNRLS